MKLKKKLFVIVSILIVAATLYFLNGFFGNPISKAKAEKEVLTYYEKKYNKNFEIYSSQFNFLIPDYNIKMGPANDKAAVFETSRYELKMYDSYGAYLASEELESKIRNILAKHDPKLKFSLRVQEEHHLEVAGIEFDFFTPDPKTRLEKNFFVAELSWEKDGRANDETFKHMDEIATLLNKELNGTPKQLSLDIFVKDPKDEKESLQRFYLNGVVKSGK